MRRRESSAAAAPSRRGPVERFRAYVVHRPYCVSLLMVLLQRRLRGRDCSSLSIATTGGDPYRDPREAGNFLGTFLWIAGAVFGLGRRLVSMCGEGVLPSLPDLWVAAHRLKTFGYRSELLIRSHGYQSGPRGHRGATELREYAAVHRERHQQASRSEVGGAGPRVREF